MLGLVLGLFLALYVTALMVGLAFVVIGAVFSGMAALFTGAASVKGVAAGIVIGFFAWRAFRKIRTENGAEKTEG